MESHWFHSKVSFTARDLFFQSHGTVLEDAGVHGFGVIDNRFEVHVSQDIFFDIDARRDFDEGQTVCGQFKDAAFGNIENAFAIAGGIGTVEGNLIDGLDEFLGLAFF